MAVSMGTTVPIPEGTDLSGRVAVLFLYMAAFLVPTGPVSTVLAAELRLSPSISLQQFYSSYTGAAQSIEDAVTSITPGISAVSKNQFIDLSLDYSLQDNFYAVRNENTLFHLANVDGQFTILRELLYLGTTLRNSEQNISNSGRNAYDNLSLSEDTSNVLSYSVDPFLRYQFGHFADMELKYSVGELLTEINDSNNENYSLSLKNGSTFSRMLWELGYTSNSQDFQNGDTVILNNMQGRIRYLLSRKLALITSLGYDENTYSNTNRVDGLLWNGGLEWNPSIRTSVQLVYGRRFFGTDLSLKASHRTRKTMLSIEYSIIPETTRNLLVRDQVFRIADPFGNSIGGPDAPIPVNINLGVPTQSNEVLILKRFTMAFRYAAKRHTFLMEFADEDREYELTGNNETLQDARFDWRIQLGGKTSADLVFRWVDSGTTIDQDEEYLITNGTLNRVIGENFNVNAGFAYIIRNSAVPKFEYTEGRVFAGINKTF